MQRKELKRIIKEEIRSLHEARKPEIQDDYIGLTAAQKYVKLMQKKLAKLQVDIKAAASSLKGKPDAKAASNALKILNDIADGYEITDLKDWAADGAEAVSTFYQ